MQKNSVKALSAIKCSATREIVTGTNRKCTRETSDGVTLNKPCEASTGELRLQIRSCVPDINPIGAATFGVESTKFFGIHTGDVTTDEAVVQVGYEPTDGVTFPPLAVRLFDRDDNCVFRLTGTTETTGPLPDSQYYRWIVTGLKSATEYNFFAINLTTRERSQIGRFVTQPSSQDEKKKFTFVLSSCYGFPVLDLNVTQTAHMNKLLLEKPDFHMQVGDFVYIDATIPLTNVSPVRPDLVQGTVTGVNIRPPLTLEEMEAAWKDEGWKVANIANGVRATAMFSIMDDHEYWNNWSSTFMRPALSVPAVTVYNIWKNYPVNTLRRNNVELWAVEDFPPNYLEDFNKAYRDAVVTIENNGKRYFYKQWGDLDLIVLDDMFDRVYDDPAGIKLISDEQMAWLKATLKIRKDSFKLVVSSKPIDITTVTAKSVYDIYLNIFTPIAANAGLSQEAAKELAAFFTAKDLGEYWYYFSTKNSVPIPYLKPTVPQTNEILDFIRNENINGVMFAGGDYHRTALLTTERGINKLPLTMLIGPVGSPVSSSLTQTITVDPSVFYAITFNNHTLVEFDSVAKTVTFNSVGDNQTTSVELFLDNHYNIKTLSDCKKMDCSCVADISKPALQSSTITHTPKNNLSMSVSSKILNDAYTNGL